MHFEIFLSQWDRQVIFNHLAISYLGKSCMNLKNFDRSNSRPFKNWQNPPFPCRKRKLSMFTRGWKIPVPNVFFKENSFLCRFKND